MKIGVIGLGYVGLPLALGIASKYPVTIGFDINQKRVDDLKNFKDTTRETESDELKKSTIKFTYNIEDLKECNFFIVAVPTPIDGERRPDLRALKGASESVGKVIKKGSIVVYESTVYPGLTEEFCGPIIEKVSGLKRGIDFKLGYSPERINPGDREHTLERVIKVVAGEDSETLEKVAEVYGSVVTAGVFKAASIKVAEAAKVIENTQRDLNIALMNELALIFDRIGISTHDVLEAAGTKWNFLKFTPGLVGGHCIGVDPYYLTTKAEQLGYMPDVILAGRRVNDGMGAFIANKALKILFKNGVTNPKVGILGLTFKENVPDIRNSRVPDIIAELSEYGITPLIHDPYADSEEVLHEYGLKIDPFEEFRELDCLILAVSHKEYLKHSDFSNFLKNDGLFIDVKGVFKNKNISKNYWSL